MIDEYAFIYEAIIAPEALRTERKAPTVVLRKPSPPRGIPVRASGTASLLDGRRASFRTKGKKARLSECECLDVGPAVAVAMLRPRPIFGLLPPADPIGEVPVLDLDDGSLTHR